MSKRVPHLTQAKGRSRNRVRIIGGIWRSRIVEFPDLVDLRPTADRVRETLFNWLGQNMVGKTCLDLFAGSGALGFEAASRGALSVTMVESTPAAVDALRRNRELLGAVQCQIVGSDAVNVLTALKQKFDVVFIDPPFASEFLAATLPKLVDCLNPGGTVYAEWREPLQDVLDRMTKSPWKVLRSGQAGNAHFALLSLQETLSTRSENA